MRDRTQPDQTIKITVLSKWAIITLLFVAVALALLFLLLAWYEGALHLPEFLFSRPSVTSPTSLRIDVIPTDAIIKINGTSYNPNTAPVPGNYDVLVSRDGYYPTKEQIRIRPNTANLINIRLMPIASAMPVAEDAADPAWDSHGNLYFLSQADSKIYRWANGSQSAVADIQGEVYQLIVSGTGDKAFALGVPGSDSPSQFNEVDLNNGTSTVMPVTGFGSLAPDGKTIWGINTDPLADADRLIWSLGSDGSPKWTSLENPSWAIGGSQALIDSSGQWLATVSAKGIAVWELGTGRLLITFADASVPVWIGGLHPGLAYRTSDGFLKFAQADLDWGSISISADMPSPLVAMPGSTEVVFTRFDPFAGGTSFWAIDTTTKGLRLLAEARTESGHASEFTVSPNGNKIAFVNEQNVLYLVTLEP